MGRAALAAGSEERPLQAAIGPPGSRQATVLSESRELSRPVGHAAGIGDALIVILAASVKVLLASVTTAVTGHV